MANTDVLISTTNLTKVYNDEGKALDNVSLDLREGEFLAVVGPSGSGKSTLLNLLGALDRPTSGEIEFSGEKMSNVRNLDHFRSRMVGFVFQLHNLISTLTALENVEIPMRPTSLRHKERVRRAKELLGLVGLADRSQHLPTQLSGGERQRVAIARALANSPRLLLADEPTGNLDSFSGAEIMAIFRQLNQEQGMSVLVVTHSPVVSETADRIITLSDGRIVSDQSVDNPYLQDLRELRDTGLGQALLAGKLTGDVQGIGLESILSDLQKILLNV